MRSFALALVVVVAGALAPTPASAQQPIVADYFSAYQALRIVGDRAYAASGAGLVIFDVSNRAAPRKLSQLFLDRSAAFKLEVSGNYVFVLSGAIVFEESLVRVVDVSDALAPRIVAEYSDLVDSRVQGMVIVGSTLALANANGVDLVNIADPTHPTKLATLPIVTEPEQVVGLAANGTTVFAAWQGLGGDLPPGGVTAIDIADPSAPTRSGELVLDQGPYGITNAGSTLYVGITTDVVVIDAADPTNLVEVTRLDFPFSSDTEVYAEAGLLFVGVITTENEFRVSVFDIQNPLAPDLLGEATRFCRVVGMDIDAGDAFMPCVDASGTGMTIFDVSANGSLDEIASVFVPDVRDVAIAADGTTFLVGSSAISAVRPLENGSVETLDTLALPQRAIHLQLVGTVAYVSTALSVTGADLHIQVVDVSDPTNLRIVGSLAVAFQSFLVGSKRFYVEGTTLYVATPSGLDIYDVSNPSQITRLGTFATPDPAVNVIVSGKFAYVTTRRVANELQQVDLYVVNVSKPARPKQKGRARSVDVATYIDDLALRDGTLYLLTAGPGTAFPNAGDGRLVVIDVNKPKKPRVRATIPTNPDFSGYAFEIALAGDLAYVADGLAGVSVISVANATAPQYVRSIDTPGFTTGIALDADGNVAVADESSYQLYAPEP